MKVQHYKAKAVITEAIKSPIFGVMLRQRRSCGWEISQPVLNMSIGKLRKLIGEEIEVSCINRKHSEGNKK